MKSEYDKKLKVYVAVPETALEALDQLEGFLETDMWYAKGAEWKTELDMLKYLHSHMDICKRQIKKLELLNTRSQTKRQYKWQD